jgi:citrate lyase subunit beta/citryl-CoA lyase
MVKERGGPRYRSMLFAPYQKADWLLAGVALGADAVVFDLEDMVPVAQKREARDVTRDGITQLMDQPIGRFVRINGWQTGYLVDDLFAVVTDGLDGVGLPKSESANDVVALDFLLTELEVQRGLPPGHIEIIPFAETASGMFLSYELITASPRVKRYYGVINATQEGDGAHSLNLKLSRDGHEWIPIGTHILLAARAAGVTNILGATAMEPENLVAARQLAELSAAYGANGALVVHPQLIPIINDVYSPSKEEVEHAREVVLAVASGLGRGESATVFNGEIATYSHVRAALDLLAVAASFGIDVGELPDIELPASVQFRAGT